MEWMATLQEKMFEEKKRKENGKKRTKKHEIKKDRKKKDDGQAMLIGKSVASCTYNHPCIQYTYVLAFMKFLVPPI